MHLLASMGPPGGGRMVISKRLQSRFNLINMTFPQVDKYALLTNREVKMAVNWPSSVFRETKSRSMKSQIKNEVNIQPS